MLFAQGLIGLTEEQAQDLMFIRRLYRTKRRQLETQRKAIVSQMADVELQDVHPSDSFVSLSVLASRVQHTTTQLWRVYYQVLQATYRGVRPLLASDHCCC